MKLNLANFNEEALERRELRQRRNTQQARAIRQASHRSVRAAEPKHYHFGKDTAVPGNDCADCREAFVCPDCGGDCKSLMADMQAVLKGGRL